jgi:hypothetical protein
LYLPKDFVHDSFIDLVSSILSKKGSGEVLQFMDVLQPVLIESLILESYVHTLTHFGRATTKYLRDVQTIHNYVSNYTIAKNWYTELYFYKMLDDVN